MGNDPLVSVIIIFLNEEQFIQEAIDSVFAQTYKNWELILVDDGSSDASSRIALQCAENNSGNVRYCEHMDHKNRGMSASRNLGVRAARGEYISYLDSDDVWLPHKLEQQVKILQSRPEAAMVYGPIRLWFSWTKNYRDIRRDYLLGVCANGFQPFSNQLVEQPAVLTLFLKNEFFMPAGFMVRRVVIERTGGFEEIFHDAYSDAVFLVKVCLSHPVYVSSECCYWYRQHPRSNTHVSRLQGKENAEQFFYLNWIKQYFLENEVRDAEVWQALEKALRRNRHPNMRLFFERLEHLLRQIGLRTLPEPVRHWLWVQWQSYKNILQLKQFP
jgi:glycosyltransferase involved in cell wall biosynthesis